MMFSGLFEDFNKVKNHHIASNSNFIFKLWNLKKICDHYSRLLKGEYHGDRISYAIYYGGFEGIGWEKSGSTFISCLSSFQTSSCIHKSALSSFVGGLFSGVEVEK